MSEASSHLIYALRAGDCLRAIEVSATDLLGRCVEDAAPYNGLCVGDVLAYEKGDI